MPADRLKSIEPGCAFPKLYRVPVYKQFDSLPSLRLIVYLKVNSERYVPLIIDYVCAKLSHDSAQNTASFRSRNAIETRRQFQTRPLSPETG
jgi:hypothetical protein